MAGPRRLLTEEAIEKAWRIYRDECKTLANIAPIFGVSAPTLYQALKTNEEYKALAKKRMKEQTWWAQRRINKEQKRQRYLERLATLPR